MEKRNGIVASDQYEKLKSYPTLPAIGASDSNVFLAGNGAFLKPSDVAFDVATQTDDGLMSKEDKIKLDGIAAGAQVNSVAGVKGNAESSYRTGNVNLTPANIGAATSDHSHSAATSGAAGFMSSADKQKLDGIAAGAQVNAVTGIKGNAETAYRTGSVNLTPANIGAAAASHTHAADDINSGVLSIARGGTGATTAAGILTNIGAAASNHNHDSTYAAKSHTHNYAGSASAGGSASSAVKLDGFIKTTSQTWGQQAGSFITGMSDGNACDMAWRKNCPSAGKVSYIVDGLFYQNEGAYPCIDTSYLPLSVANGGTGATTAASARQNLFPTDMATTADYFIAINGGWQTGGYVTLAKARSRMGLGDTTGALPVANGGTGANSAANARSNLGITPANIGAAAASHTHANATTSNAGFLAPGDQKKLNAISSDGAGVTIPSGGVFECHRFWLQGEKLSSGHYYEQVKTTDDVNRDRTFTWQVGGGLVYYWNQRDNAASLPFINYNRTGARPLVYDGWHTNNGYYCKRVQGAEFVSGDYWLKCVSGVWWDGLTEATEAFQVILAPYRFWLTVIKRDLGL